MGEWSDLLVGIARSFETEKMNITTTYSNESLGNETTSLYQAPQWVYQSSAVALFAIGFLGIGSNLVTIIVYLMEKVLWTPFNLLLMNLIVLEFLSSSFGLPLNFAAALHEGWTFGPELCSATAFVMSVAGIGSISMLTLLSLHRCLLICLPHHSARFNSKISCSLILILSWINTAFVTLPPVFGWGYFKLECLGLSCGPAWDDPDNYSYTSYLLFMGFVVPAVVITLTSTVLVVVMKKHSAQIQLASLKSAMAKKELRVTKMVMAMTFSFLGVWSPYAICAIFVIAGQKDLLNSPLAVVPLILAKTSTFTNPMLYVVLNPQFQRAFKRLVGLPVNTDENIALATCKTVVTGKNVDSSLLKKHNRSFKVDGLAETGSSNESEKAPKVILSTRKSRSTTDELIGEQ